MRKFVKAGLCGLAAAVLVCGGCSAKTEQDPSSQETDAQAGSGEAGSEAGGAQDGAAPAEEGATEEYIAEGSITLGEYKGIPVTVMKAEVTEEEIDQVIDNYLNSSATYEESDEAAVLGDTVNIDYKGLMDGTAFDRGSDTNFDLLLGSGRFIDGFEDGLVGVKKGEKRDLNLRFPEPYPNNPDMAGREVVFEVTVNAVKKRIVPELTDEFVAASFPEDKTVEGLRKSLREMLLSQKQSQIENSRDSQLLEEAMQRSEIVCATDQVNEALELQVDSVTRMAAGYGYDLASYAGLMGMDEAGLRAELKQAAVYMVKQEMTLDAIAEAEGIAVSQEDKEALAKEYGYESLSALLESQGVTEELVEDTVKKQKALRVLSDNAQVTEEAQ
ncbi:MAG: trigger factor [Clostridium sp.]|jgi:trigger factor|nr:trigger factor [Clostridium sp.]